MTDPIADIRSAVRETFQHGPPERLGVAVSGGGDSVALLHILLTCFDSAQVDLHVATVDHGLRPEAQAEALWVADFCEQQGVAHSTLRWRGWDGTGNLQDKARQARYALLADWAKAYGLTEIALGHTADDQAETFLMRLGRASGVDGLAAMSCRRTVEGVNILRPMLSLKRDQLRQYLRQLDIAWIDDPSNEDTSFHRIRVRKALEQLTPLGIDAKTLAEVAGHMGQARAALDWYTFLAARDCVDVSAGDIVIDHRTLRTLPEEIARRLLSKALRWVGSSAYAPRSVPMADFVAAARDRRPATLAGCHMLHQGKSVWICREFNAVSTLSTAPSDIWDGRWALSGPPLPDGGCEIRALGLKGIMNCTDWRACGHPYASLLSSPAVWRGPELVAAPLAGYAQGWRADLHKGAEDFYAGLLAH